MGLPYYLERAKRASEKTLNGMTKKNANLGQISYSNLGLRPQFPPNSHFSVTTFSVFLHSLFTRSS